MVAKSFKELIIWQKSMDLVEKVYGLTRTFPKEELYVLTSQMRRAALSVPSNIAEGFVRKFPKEFKQHLNVVLGSLAELESQLILSKRLNFLSEASLEELAERIDHLGKMVTKFRQSL